jgi:hypothetical protein
MPDFPIKEAFTGKLNEQGGELRSPARALLRPDEENHAQFTRVQCYVNCSGGALPGPGVSEKGPGLSEKLTTKYAKKMPKYVKQFFSKDAKVQ